MKFKIILPDPIANALNVEQIHSVAGIDNAHSVTLAVPVSFSLAFSLSFSLSFFFGFLPVMCTVAAYASGPNSFEMNFLKDAEYQRFFIWFSDLDELKHCVLISTHRLPYFLWPFQRRRSSARENGMWLMFGLRWLTHRSRICLPTRPGRTWFATPYMRPNVVFTTCTITKNEETINRSKSDR